jgi:hypothetical protein
MASGNSGAQASPELTAFQLEVARLFFGLPESKDFLLAGGAALLAQHLTDRPVWLPAAGRRRWPVELWAGQSLDLAAHRNLVGSVVAGLRPAWRTSAGLSRFYGR